MGEICEETGGGHRPEPVTSESMANNLRVAHRHRAASGTPVAPKKRELPLLADGILENQPRWAKQILYNFLMVYAPDGRLPAVQLKTMFHKLEGLHFDEAHVRELYATLVAGCKMHHEDGCIGVDDFRQFYATMAVHDLEAVSHHLDKMQGMHEAAADPGV